MPNKRKDNNRLWAFIYDTFKCEEYFDIQYSNFSLLPPNSIKMMLQILKGTNGRLLHNLGQNKLKITTTPQIKDVKVVCFDINRASSFIYLLIYLLFGRRGEGEEGRGGGREREEGEGEFSVPQILSVLLIVTCLNFKTCKTQVD